METFTPEMKALVIARLEQKLAEGRLSGTYTLSGLHLTPEQVIDQVRRGTPFGEEIIFAQKQFMDELKRR